MSDTDINDENLTRMVREIGLKQIELVFNKNIAEVYLNNPPHNYVSVQVLTDLCAIYEHFLELRDKSDYKLKGIIITGKGRRTFSSGASLDMIGRLQKGGAARNAFMELSNKTKMLMSQFDIPVIAAINGICLGAGLEIALQCHYRVCGKGIYLGFPEIQLGLMPGAGGTQYLPRLIGRSKALYMMLSGKFFTAEEAFHMGGVDRVVPRKNVLGVARGIANEICNQHSKAVRYILKAVEAGEKMALESGIKLEEELFWELVDDRIEAGGISNDDVGMKILGAKKEK